MVLGHLPPNPHPLNPHPVSSRDAKLISKASPGERLPELGVGWMGADSPKPASFRLMGFGGVLGQGTGQGSLP